MPRSFIKFLVPGHHGRSLHPEYFVFLVALSARIKTTKRINQMAMDGYGLYFGAKSNQSLAVDVDYGTCLIPYHSSSMERYFTEFLQRFFLLRFRINSLPLSSCSFLEWTVFDVFSVFTGLGKSLVEYQTRGLYKRRSIGHMAWQLFIHQTIFHFPPSRNGLASAHCREHWCSRFCL